MILIRYDNPRNLAIDVASRGGKFLACGVDIMETGLASQDTVGRLIESLADARDRQLPQRGDQPKFAVDVETGRYVREGYSCTSDHVRGGFLELMPLEGAQFIHREWQDIKSCRTGDLTRQVWKNSSWALNCIQMDLRHHIGRLSGTTTLDGRDRIVLHDVIKCDEGVWVLIDDLVRKDILWSSPSRRITQSAANLRDRDQRMHIYNERLQLIINGNVLSSRKPNGKVRLQFLGIRVKEPPAGPYTLGSAGSDMMVSTFEQITEINHDPNLRRHQVNIAQSMETAAAAVPATGPEEDDHLDAMTVAEPEMEVDVQGSEAEPEHADDIPDIEEYPEDINDNSNEERQAVLLPGTTPVMDPKLQIARTAMQPVFYLDSRVGNCVDANRAAFSYAAYFVCRTIYKMWPSTVKWMTLTK